jgi:VIT1/CCC1 family predicted Fe2+/Mn2+ transporter
MMGLSQLFARERLFAWVIGPVDGILTALILESGHIVRPEQPIDLLLAVRIAVAAALSGGFVFFVAEYARLRGELEHAERHLNLRSRGRLVVSNLGRKIFADSAWGTAIAAISGFLGALVPLLLGSVFQGVPWVAIPVAVAVLGLLGAMVARTVRGTASAWAVTLMLGGAALSVAGMWLHVT